MKRTQRSQKDAQARVKPEKFTQNRFPAIVPKTENQELAFEAIRNKNKVVALAGSAGTGKTFISCWFGAQGLHYKTIKKVVLIRAYQPLANRTIGFLPGTAEEKLQPYYQQMLDYLEDFMGKGALEIAMKHKEVEICSLETIRGRSWDDCLIIVDESQNLFVEEIQALTTRIGRNSQMLLCGDNSGIQSDVKKNVKDGLTYLEYIVKKYQITDTAFIQFTRDDILRDDIVKQFVIAFEEELLEEQRGKYGTN